MSTWIKTILISQITVLLIVFNKTNRRLFEIQRAIVLFNIEAGYENLVLNKIKTVEGVEESYITYGVYDIAVKVRADSMEALKDLISNQLRKIKKVRSTISLILVVE